MDVTVNCPALMVAKLPLTMLFLALRLTSPVPPFALSEPAKFKPEPVDLRITLPVEAVMVDKAVELSEPLATTSKSPLAVLLVETKLRLPVLVRNTPVEASAETLPTCETFRRPDVPVPIEPETEVRFN